MKKTYYQMTGTEVQKAVNGSTKPLTDEKILENQRAYGPNELTGEEKKSTLQIFLEQFKDFLVIILIVAAVVSGFLGEMESALVILVVITMNAILGTVQTKKAEQSLDSLKAMSGPEAKVFRGGRVEKVPSREVTVGELIFLEAGDYVPADGRILENASLKVDESALTGESLGVDKTEDPIDGEVPLGDRKNMVHSGSFVTYGRGTYIATAIGMDTEVGKIATLLKSASEKKTPLQANLDDFGRKLSIVILVFCAILFGVSVLVRKESPGQAFLFAVALAVAAIPEALSSIVTIVLSFGTTKMARENAIIRKLQSVEGLGSVSVICSDKTGTLTQNKMTVEAYYVDGREVSTDDIDLENPMEKKMLRFSSLCNDAKLEKGDEIGDPTETALIILGAKLGKPAQVFREKYPRLQEIPFDSDRKLMSTLHEVKGKITMVTKGAVDVLLDRVDAIEENGEIRPFTQEDKNRVEAKNRQFSENGRRVLAFAYKFRETEEALDLKEEDHLVFLGLIAMMDPPREESRQAVAECIQAGIKPIMITGDHKVTAAAIAKRIGILKEDSEACEGAVIDSMSDEELQDFVEGVSVYARVSPEHKIRIVRAWQAKGNLVAMTGDGVNDAPALKQADIGVAMGITGSEVAKDAASMILTDDNFATIVKAVENGRNIYRNIKNSILFLLSGNFAGILAVLYAALANLPVPFAPVHLLFINLLTDSLPAIALGLEPHTKDVMSENPRPMSESILTKSFLTRVGIDGLCIAAMTMAAFYLGYGENARLASTMAFGTLCISRLVHGFNCKSKRPVLFKKAFFNNLYLFGAFFTGLLLVTLVLMLPPLAGIFSVQTLTWNQLLMVYLLSFLNLPILQILKALWKR